MSEKFREVSHFHGDGMFGYSYQSITRPRLTFVETCYRKTRSTERKWFVDHDAVDPEEIEARIIKTPTFDADEVASLSRITDEWVDRRKQADWRTVMMLHRRGAVECQAGKVRLWPVGDPRWPYAYPDGVR